ncbi:MAG: acyl-CoA dehydratase activase-related protein [Planctomycetaceae bacterium]|nr:acyl-CoA dehydratase activase-related protein [Planctomycetaceae bacterium]
MITETHSKCPFSPLRLGLDIGSTTVKVVVYDDSSCAMRWSRYSRHYSEVFQTLTGLVSEVLDQFPDTVFTVAVTGSAGIGVSQKLMLPFVQEVIAGAESIEAFLPQTDVAIELGGEDAKITFFNGSIDQRMNETCAGGTGAFIDQIAVTLKTDALGIDALASHHKTIYPIAARCGVFTKSDVTMLLNDGASKEDVAASVLQAVVDQTIGGLACGRKIHGNVAFLGGPLHFLPQLHKRFAETLNLSPRQQLRPDDAHFYVALGAALLSKTHEPVTGEVLRERIRKGHGQREHSAETDRLCPLFSRQEDYQQFLVRHDSLRAKRTDFDTAAGGFFLGIDSGSTTTKAVLIDEQSQMVRSWYGSNQGDPVHTVMGILSELYAQLPPGAAIRNSCVTGYGEMILQAALGIDEGEVETLAHYRAAGHFVKDVSFILDIGGQDIKCISIKNGRIDRIALNEACSSGCGSFIETFANSLGYDVAAFAREALFAKKPIDLGTRCTVFMNSKVKQAQKENAPVSDISAGLAYSVAKNALYKVLKIRDVSELGDRIVVQGGTFNNPAVLRALELLIGRNVYRVDISGMMGAFGAALIARERAMHSGKTASALISREGIASFSMTSAPVRCRGCSNKCLTTVHRFFGGKTFISGNRCEKGLGHTKSREKINLFRSQYERLFDYYIPRRPEDAPLGEIGLPRVLNMYENYPFWFTLFHELGFRVVLSDPSGREWYNKGLDSVSSQTLCFPAKLAHGHILNLVEKGVRRIFYPALPLERQEFKEAVRHYNCPVVAAYPEVIRLNVGEIREKQIQFLAPFLPAPADDTGLLLKQLSPLLKPMRVGWSGLKRAVSLAETAQKIYKEDIRRKGEEAVAEITASGEPAIVLAGRPYHLDPMIHHGIPEMILACGAAVLSGDSVMSLGQDLLFPFHVVDQWTYHSRLYRAATFVARHSGFQLVQLNSFGCGLDAVTTGQVEEILTSVGKTHTLLKIDEGTQLGAVKIRIRSLLSTCTVSGTE